nr:MAG TPA: hypothetical protein [Caudoviricetes sp.]
MRPDPGRVSYRPRHALLRRVGRIVPAGRMAGAPTAAQPRRTFRTSILLGRGDG